MSYALARSTTLPPGPWAGLTLDLGAFIRKMNATRRIVRGPHGDGEPIVDAARIAFNGNIDRGDYMRRLRKHRLAVAIDDEDDAHEDFALCRLMKSPHACAQHIISCNTSGKPYDAAVRAAIVLLRHHYPHDTFLHESAATMDEWHDTWHRLQVAIPTLALPAECLPQLRRLWVTPTTLRLLPRPTR